MQASDDFQFYPTPRTLAVKAWAKFQNQRFTRVLEPSSGEGHLASAAPSDYRKIQIDCIELDITKHARLRDQGFDVVGIDFMRFDDGAIYSHIILNPPFYAGADHVLKAWNILYCGEIVAIINAETIKNAYTKERQMLVRLIEQHGSVEYMSEAFTGEDAQRKTEVEIALVHLKKDSRFDLDIKGSILEGLETDKTTDESLGEGFREMNDIAISNSSIENAVTAFNAAYKAIKEGVFAEARASYYTGLVGDTLERMNGDGPADTMAKSLETVRKDLYERYKNLKNRAWAGILRSTQVTSRLSSAAQKRIESEFEAIQILDFTAANIYGFLAGLSKSQGEIQIGMLCDVFDLITRFHSENAVWYMGWKSNDKHRTCGMRVRATRFVIPGNANQSWRNSASWETLQMLRDFDKVFAMLDGKLKPEVSLEDLFEHNYGSLKAGDRLKSSYFDVRFYQGIGTIHFLAGNKKLIDRLNRLVGFHRQWLPPEGTPVNDAFWLQYESAEKFDKQVQSEITKTRKGRWNDPLWKIHSKYDEEKAEAENIITNAIAVTLETNGISVDALLGGEQNQQLLLCA